VLKARRSSGAYRIPLETGLLIPSDKTLIRPLGDHLQKVSTLSGSADISAVREMYEEWYRKARREFEEQPNRALAMPFFNRLRTQVVKLALIYHVSQSVDLCISPASMQRAIEKASDCQETIFSLLPTGMSREGAEVEKMADRIRQAGSEGLLKSVLTKAFSHIRSNEREGRLGTLVQSADVVRFSRDTSGRRAEVLVHKEYAAEYARKFPLDQQWH
jgi:hypothetical protein